MRRQTNMAQKKEQNKTPEKELSKTEVGADLGLHHPGNPRANTPSRQLHTKVECHHPAPAQLIFHGGQRLVVRGHSQSLHMSGLGKFFPLICQQQTRLNYKRREYSAHMEGAPQISSLGDRGGCATGSYRTPTTLVHTTKTGRHSSST